MRRSPCILLLAFVGAAEANPPGAVPPPLPGRGEAERAAPTVGGFTTDPVRNDKALSGPFAPVQVAPGSRVPAERRGPAATPGRPATAGPDPLNILNRPTPLVPVDASISDRNALDTSFRVFTPEYALPTGFRTAFAHPDDASYSVRLDGALMLVYRDGLYARRNGRLAPVMPAGAWYVIGREDQRVVPRGDRSAAPGVDPAGPMLQASVAPAPVAPRTTPLRLDLKVQPTRADATSPAGPPTPVPAARPAEEETRAVPSVGDGPRILRDETYRRALLRALLGRSAR